MIFANVDPSDYETKFPEIQQEEKNTNIKVVDTQHNIRELKQHMSSQVSKFHLEMHEMLTKSKDGVMNYFHELSQTVSVMFEQI